ncbi:hypothetical protein ACFU5O_24090 [Streptomyces sp. NPDC057445]|uniref:hypothetical protein n=1 Tax=Streptomyces sp. NPDC057445 TaxID=3346136 RepID=UPI0036A14160
MTSRVDCHVRYDPEVDVALLSFTESSASPGGTALEFNDESGLAGLLRLGSEGKFDHLELLGAKRAVPQLIADLRPPAPGARDYCRGVVNVHVTATEQGAVRFDLDDIATTGNAYEVSVQAKSPSSTLATLRYDGDSGVLHSLTLFPSGNLLGGLARFTSN